MLQKNKKSALILSGVTVVSFVLAAAAIFLLPAALNGQEPPFAGDSNAAAIKLPAVLGLVLFLMLAATGFLAYFLYTYFGEAYYGKRSAWRWALFGALYGLLLGVPNLFGAPQTACLSLFWAAFCLFPAFLMARKLIPRQAQQNH